MPWADEAWLEGVRRWIDDRLSEVGLRRLAPVEQPHVRPWSTVLRATTDAGSVWFKANHAALAREAAVVSLIASRRPDVVPQLLAIEAERGWMLMADGGERLREVVARERSIERWLEILPLYAGLQIDVADDADALVSLGEPDRRLAGLPEQVGSLDLDSDQQARVEEWCARLAALGVPETIEHDDLHDGQVFVQGRRYLFFDWGDACVTHPFCTLSVTLQGSLRWGLDDVEDSVDIAPFRDAYLEPFERYASRAELVDAADAAMRLGWIVRVLFYRDAAAALGPDTDLDAVKRRLELAFTG